MKKIFEAASVLTVIFFVVMIAVGFFFKTQNVREKTKDRHHHQKKMERQDEHHKYELEAEKKRTEEYREEPNEVIDEWEAYYQNFIQYNKGKQHFDRGNEIEFPPPLKESEST